MSAKKIRLRGAPSALCALILLGVSGASAQAAPAEAPAGTTQAAPGATPAPRTAVKPKPAAQKPAAPKPPAEAPPASVDDSATGGSATATDQAPPIESFDLDRSIMGESGGLTADDAAKRARARAPQLASARASVDANQADADIAWVNFLPKIDLTAQYKRINRVINNFSIPGAPMPADDAAVPNFTQPLNNYSLIASASYPISDVFLRAWPLYKASVGLAEAQRTQTDVTEAVVDLNARTAYYEYARALAQRAVDEQALKQAQAQSDQIKLFVDAGTVARVDLMTAVARVEESRSALATSDTKVSIAQNDLATLLGIPSEQVHGLGEAVLESPKPLTTPADELVRRGLAERPELKAMRKMVTANDHLHTAQRNTALPQLVLSASDLYGQPNQRYIPPNRDTFKNSWELGAAVVWTPNNTLTGYYSGKKAGAQLAKSRADLLAQEDTVRREVVSAYQSYKAAEAVTAASAAQLSAADEAYRVRLSMYRVGSGVIVDLLQADLTVTRARLARANAAISARLALAQLRRATGADL